ncbi:MAG: hypothetical protein Q9227_000896 [Pyrenula ochraceoflavens]
MFLPILSATTFLLTHLTLAQPSPPPSTQSYDYCHGQKSKPSSWCVLGINMFYTTSISPSNNQPVNGGNTFAGPQTNEILILDPSCTTIHTQSALAPPTSIPLPPPYSSSPLTIVNTGGGISAPPFNMIPNQEVLAGYMPCFNYTYAGKTYAQETTFNCANAADCPCAGKECKRVGPEGEKGKGGDDE